MPHLVGIVNLANVVKFLRVNAASATHRLKRCRI